MPPSKSALFPPTINDKEFLICSDAAPCDKITTDLCTTTPTSASNTAITTISIEAPPRRPYLGLTCGALSSVCFSFCSVIVKYMQYVDPFEMAAFRFVGVLLPTLPCLVISKQDAWPDDKRLLLVTRSILGALSIMLQFYAIQHMPLADASVIIFSLPVFVAISARIVLKEPCTIVSIVCIFLAMGGVLMIAQPPFLFHGIGSVGYNQETVWGAVAALSGTICGANLIVVLRLLKDVHWTVIMFNFGVVAITITSAATLISGDAYLPRFVSEWLLIIALGAFSFGGNFLKTQALKYEKAGPVAIARTVDIIFAFIWQVLFFNEIPTVWSIGGALLVTFSVVLVIVQKWVMSLPDTATVKSRLGFLFK